MQKWSHSFIQSLDRMLMADLTSSVPTQMCYSCHTVISLEIFRALILGSLLYIQKHSCWRESARWQKLCHQPLRNLTVPGGAWGDRGPSLLCLINYDKPRLDIFSASPSLCLPLPSLSLPSENKARFGSRNFFKLSKQNFCSFEWRESATKMKQVYGWHTPSPWIRNILPAAPLPISPELLRPLFLLKDPPFFFFFFQHRVEQFSSLGFLFSGSM